ncbi:putative ribonuclease H-like domain-containing protein, partial [Tanacetum coccineum]
KKGYANSTNRVSTVSLSVSVAGQSFDNADLPTDPLMPDFEDIADLLNTGIFSGAYDEEDEGAEADLNNLETTMNVSPIPTTRIHKDHPKDQIIRDINSATQTRKITKIYEEHAMKVYRLVNLPKGKHAIGTKWVYRNKKDERGIVVRNKARLVTQDYTQEEGIDYDQLFAPVVRIEAIWLFLAYASFMGFIVYQMDMNSAFLYGTIEEEMYVCQPPSFEDPQFPDKIYKVENALYGLHQAPRAWYETLSTYLLENRFRREIIDKTLFIKKDKGDILLVQVYVDDIIFGSTKKSLYTEFESLMHKKFQMSSIGEFTFFLGLQVMQRDDGIFISQDKYVVDILKKFNFSSVKTTSTLIETNKALFKDVEAKDVDVYLYRSLMYLTASRPNIIFVVCACARDSPFNLEAFSDSDYAGASLDRKSTIGGCQFLGKRLISWQCKKQTVVANSTTEAEYVAAANCCGQVLWIQNQMLDYGFNFMNTKIYIDNESTIYETVYKEWEDIMERAATTASSLEAEQDSVVQVPSYHIGGAKAQTRVLALEQSKTAQDLMIGKVKKKVKKLEKKLRARTPGLNLFKIGTSKRKSLDKENVSKQGRKSDKTNPMFNDSDFANVEGDAKTQGRNTAKQITRDTVNTASIDVSIDDPSTSTAGDIFKDEMMTIVDTLVAIGITRPRTTSVVIRDVKEEPKRATSVPTVQSQDKEAKDAELIEQIEDIQARIDANELLAERLQQEEREQFTIEEKSRMLVEMIAKRKRFTHNQLKNRSLEEIQILYEKEQKWIDDFVPMDSELEVQRLKRAGQEVLKEPWKKSMLKLYRSNIQSQTRRFTLKIQEDNLVKLWDLVKERFSTTEPTDDKEKELWVELKRLFEPDNDDTLWKLQRCVGGVVADLEIGVTH